MFKDDQMLPMLTGVVIMLAIGIFAQRSESVMEFLSPGSTERNQPSFALNDDTVVAEATGFTRIDVLANDTGLEIEEYRDLIIDTPPVCGDVIINGGAIQYRPTRGCGTFQSFSYRLSRRDQSETGIVRVQIGPQGVDLAKAPEPEAPAPVPSPEPVSEPVVAAAPATAPTAPKPEPAQVPETDDTAETAAVEVPSADEQQAATAPVRLEEPTAVSEPAPDPDFPIGGITVAMALPDAPLTLEPEAIAPQPEEAVVAVATPAVPEQVVLETDPVGARDLVPSALSEPDGGDTWSNGGAANRLAALPAARGAAETAALTAPGAITDGRPQILNLPQIAVTEPRTEAPTAPIAQDGTGTENLKVTGLRLADPSLETSEIAALTHSKSEFAVPRDAGLNPEPSPVQTATLAGLSEPLSTQELVGTEINSLSRLPALPTPSGGLAPLAKPDDAVELAALPKVQSPCAAPPALTFNIQPGARTEISVAGPCYGERVAELTYNDLRFAIPLDAAGNGSVVALGLEATAEAEIRFHDGEVMTFDLPFSGTDRMSHVALSWDLPVALGLHALEFNAGRGDPGDVSADNPRSYAEIRRTGGGFLTEFAPVDGAGQFVQIYSHLVRRDGQPGLVEMIVEFVSRDRDRLEGTCGTGDLARPRFTVLRSEGGRIARPFTGRLASLACSELASDTRVSAASSVGTLVISP